MSRVVHMTRLTAQRAPTVAPSYPHHVTNPLEPRLGKSTDDDSGHPGGRAAGTHCRRTSLRGTTSPAHWLHVKAGGEAQRPRLMPYLRGKELMVGCAYAYD